MRIVRANAPGGNADRNPIAPAAATGQPAAPGALPPLTAENFEVAGGPNVLNLLHVAGEQQVMLHVVVAEMNRTAARSIGLNFSVSNNSGVTVFSNSTGNVGSIGFGGGSGAGGLGGSGAGNLGAAAGAAGSSLLSGAVANINAIVDAGRVPLALNALRTLNYAKSLAEPTLVTLDGHPANFQAGGQFPVPIVTGFTASGLQGVQFIPFGVQLSFTPFITDRDRIRLLVNANVSSRDVSTGATINGTGVPGLTTRNFDTTVELREGETLAVAGLIQTNDGADSTRVPFLGEIPGIGPLTGFTDASAGEQELVILITPELAHPMACNQVPPLPGADLFEPNDVEFYLIGRIESHCPYNYRSPIRTDLSRVLQYRHMEDSYLSGPTGFGN